MILQDVAEQLGWHPRRCGRQEYRLVQATRNGESNGGLAKVL